MGLTWEQWIDVEALIRLRWPEAPIPEDAVRRQAYADLAVYELGDILTAIDRYHAAGSPWPPRSSELRAGAIEAARIRHEQARHEEDRQRPALPHDTDRRRGLEAYATAHGGRSPREEYLRLIGEGS
jgi:hypothetical protein